MSKTLKDAGKELESKGWTMKMSRVPTRCRREGCEHPMARGDERVTCDECLKSIDLDPVEHGCLVTIYDCDGDELAKTHADDCEQAYRQAFEEAEIAEELGRGPKWEVWDTGGGCQALACKGKRYYLMITNADAEVPAPDDVCTLCVYENDPDGQEVPILAIDFPNLEVAKKSIIMADGFLGG